MALPLPYNQYARVTFPKAIEGNQSSGRPRNGLAKTSVKTILKIGGGLATKWTTFLKKIGFTAPNGTPTELYKKFRNSTSSKAAVATESVRHMRRSISAMSSCTICRMTS